MPAPGGAGRGHRANCGPESRIGITNRFRRDKSETLDCQLALRLFISEGAEVAITGRWALTRLLSLPIESS